MFAKYVSTFFLKHGINMNLDSSKIHSISLVRGLSTKATVAATIVVFTEDKINFSFKWAMVIMKQLFQ